MSYLDQNNAGTSYCEVIEVQHNNISTNFAIFSGSDPSLITCEKTSSMPGIYRTEDFNEQIVDRNITSIVESWYSRNVNTDLPNPICLRTQIKILLATVVAAEFKPLRGMPKLNKMLTNGLGSIKELMTIYETVDAFEFLCFGYRPPIAEYLDQTSYNSTYYFPDRFYAAACFETRFSAASLNLRYISVNNPNVFIPSGILVITNNQRDKFSFLLPAAWKKHSDFLMQSFAEI